MSISIPQGTSRQVAAEHILSEILANLYASANCLPEGEGCGYADAEVDNLAPGRAQAIVADYFADKINIAYTMCGGYEGFTYDAKTD